MVTGYELGQSPERALATVRDLAEASPSPAVRTQLGWFEAAWYGAQGRHAEAQVKAAETYELYRRTRRWSADVIYLGSLALVRVDTGQLGDLTDAADAVAHSTYSVSVAEASAWALTEFGRKAEARAFAGPMGSVPNVPDDWLWLSTMVAAALVRADLADEVAARVLYRRLLPHAGCVGIAGSLPLLGSVDLALARLAVLLGDRTAARNHAAAAVRIEERLGALAWLARALVTAADVATDRQEASALRARAAGIASDLGLVPVLQRLEHTG
ncbi:MAG: hypothetical protein M3314_00870 [Actinomycetota bacterium]|nr:hypothetical protein [Actinomycetota bacterium]